MERTINLPEMPLVPYQELGNWVQDGDILMYSGEDEISQLIRWATRSQWSHVGILLKVASADNRLMLLESVENMGVRLIPLSIYIKNIEREEVEEMYYARLVVARHQMLHTDKISTLLNFGLEQITRPYDREEIQRIMRRIATGEGKIARDKAYMCSELVYECFLAAGIEIPYNHLGFISPEDIWCDPAIVPIAEIDHL
ncbi:MAG: hypothetical protein HC913_03385 [Microscillaceae bacterium]|nr:hypothetical protein [Microscillaceae bacterium]